ncbi:hypothetical protein [Leptospira paudalimensis]|uniref:Glycosyltransferase RgtA/B/C/D-like domain-containing protein n=1 Tax=Leptospira paudalimensis TaxID=2950024 RepID=A0ABT3MAU1_9LEPT|nr:hypothetical protein [Leptospira paudalimensis]MCW7505505.1 hypothetical protein [Leptospira paudalimensis]
MERINTGINSEMKFHLKISYQLTKTILVSIVSFIILLKLPPLLFAAKSEAKVFNFGMYHLIQNPWTENTQWDQFLTPWILWVSGLISKPEDLVFILNCITILSGVILVGLISYQLDWLLGLTVCFLLSSSPLYLIFQTWIGFSDPFTFLLVSLYLILLYSEFLPKLKTFGLSLVLFLGMTNHLFQMLSLVLLVNVLYLVYHQDKIKMLFGAFLLASVLYTLFLVSIFTYTSIGWNQTRVSVFSQMWGNEFIRMNQSELFLGTVGLFHGLWPLVVYIMYRMPISLLGFVFCYLLSMMTYDTGRVFAILSTPILLLLSIQNWQSASIMEKRIWILFSIASPIICKLYPLFYKWDGKIIYLQ